MPIAPALFVSHGSPMFALDAGALGPRLTAFGARLAGLAAVLVVSPHWQTRGVEVMTAAQPATVHDFKGFPPALYALRYDAPGAPAPARRALQALADAGFEARENARQGRDHGAWVPMRYLLPEARIPVFQVSLPVDINAAGAHALGRALAPLRAEGIAVVGSGSLTHNLFELGREPADAAYAQEFADWIRAHVLAGDTQALIDYRVRAPHAVRAHPTEEHFLPLLVAAGASSPGDAVRALEGGMTYGTLSMDSYAWTQ